jgi:4,5-DOPA dioxygenase extradiol
MMPSYFIAHGSPLLAIEENEYTKFLVQLGHKSAKPKAIVLFSAHWISRVQQVSEVDEYSTIYDFGGFPDALYQIEYPAKGSQALAEEIKELFAKDGISFQSEMSRGLDHGAWVVLRLLYPNAEIPVISMSVNPELSPEQQYKIGKSLAELRNKDVMIIASGGTVHNLRAIDWRDNGEVTSWALEFDQRLETHLNKWDMESLFQYETLAPSAQLAVPRFGSEHFIPIFYAMGAANDEQKATLLHRSFRYGSLSHSVWQFG